MIDLYRYYDADGVLLYVGISLHAAARASQHKGHQPWWPQVASMTVEHLETTVRAEAEAVEREAILSERPQYNVTHNAGADLIRMTAEASALNDAREAGLRDSGKGRRSGYQCEACESPNDPWAWERRCRSNATAVYMIPGHSSMVVAVCDKHSAEYADCPTYREWRRSGEGLSRRGERQRVGDFLISPRSSAMLWRQVLAGNEAALSELQSLLADLRAVGPDRANYRSDQAWAGDVIAHTVGIY